MRDHTVERLMPSSRAAPCGPASTPPVSLERPDDVLPFHLLESEEAVGRRAGPLQHADMLGEDDAALAQDDGAFEDVGELAHVARPVVDDQPRRARASSI